MQPTTRAGPAVNCAKPSTAPAPGNTRSTNDDVAVALCGSVTASVMSALPAPHETSVARLVDVVKLHDGVVDDHWYVRSGSSAGSGSCAALFRWTPLPTWVPYDELVVQSM